MIIPLKAKGSIFRLVFILDKTTKGVGDISKADEMLSIQHDSRWLINTRLLYKSRGVDIELIETRWILGQ